MNIPIIYEDDWLLVVDKPSGLLTIPTPRNESRTLSSILNDYAKEKSLSYRFHPCHRLDRETSGLIIYAKGKSIQEKMMGLFKSRKIKKTYIAFVQGQDLRVQGCISMPIEGKTAITNYSVIQRHEGFLIVRAVPLSGRTNQLRIHFKHMGYPILGETKYAFRRDFKIKAKRLCLHAESIEFIHPVTFKKIFLESPMPREMAVLCIRSQEALLSGRNGGLKSGESG